jgi:short-subunit dehydrogenase
MAEASRRLAVVTGASTGIGYELARCCAENGFDLVVAADEPAIDRAAEEFRRLGATTNAVQVDRSTMEGVDEI